MVPEKPRLELAVIWLKPYPPLLQESEAGFADSVKGVVG